MNAGKNQPMAIANDPADVLEFNNKRKQVGLNELDEHWQWRMQSAEVIAVHMDPERFGVAGFYVSGSTKNANAGPQSDIDLIIHFRGTEVQHKEMLTWLEGWSLCQGQINYSRTG
jgi:hypothetical protein